MSKKRGLSVDEKRTRLLELFFEKKQFYQLKELEKIAPKEKGISKAERVRSLPQVASMSVKEILQSLVDDDLVDSDRIGTSNYFWAFPSKAANTRKRKLDDLEGKLADLQKKKANLEQQVKASQVGKEDSEERLQLLKSLEEKQAKRRKLAAELEQYKSCDPERLKEMRKQIAVASEAANRWTENVFAIKTWCKSKFGLEESQIDKQFGIPDDFDYL